MAKLYSKYRWLFHGLVMVVTFIPPIILINSIGVAFMQSTRMFLFGIVTIPFYLVNIVWLIPIFLKRRKYWQYVLCIVTIIVIYHSFIQLLSPVGARSLIITSQANESIEIPMNTFAPVISFFLMTLTLGTTFEMLLDWERQGKVIEKTEKEKLSAELSFLKSQINPHFFFNTLNSIYALAATDTEMTQRAILLLSNLMRYILYESNVDRITLSKEIQFLRDYIDLQKLRYVKTNGKEVKFEHRGSTNAFKIEPLLLVTFVENAFKHSHSYETKSVIDVTLETKDQSELIFRVSNTVGDFSEQLEKDAGIGLENVKRRLELLYPGRHQLAIDKINGYFNVVLTLSK
ncbi:sensor histidine kinase [Tunicatimonas pelagia]|uniref:sensor histidine kinase n=1 Tax=Tunicatimonas pelagia TaxID=931531 RepID=UPI0026662492|nr:sensor histidine kinase [Tunicatimonas pelagia]WKN43188.1 sensor histidine kinase [Tunicatimonas pelagia]